MFFVKLLKRTISNNCSYHGFQGAIKMMHPSLKDMALQNMVMKKVCLDIDHFDSNMVTPVVNV